MDKFSRQSRKIPLTDSLIEVLNNIPRITDYVFVNLKTMKPYTDIKNSWSTLMEKANIENFRFHDLRHTVATRMVEKGVPLPVVQEIMGHAKISTTMRYAHVVPRQKLEAINVLDSYK
ncbi:site-specific integrase [bacterium]|nr:site-specific integrase [bacterium]